MADSLLPCDECKGSCCKATSGWAFAVRLDPDEADNFTYATVYDSQYSRFHGEVVLPYVDGKCPYLEDDRCSVYEDRPRVCKRFQCTDGYRCYGNKHNSFLDDNPQVLELIQLRLPGLLKHKDQVWEESQRRRAQQSPSLDRSQLFS